MSKSKWLFTLLFIAFIIVFLVFQTHQIVITSLLKTNNKNEKATNTLTSSWLFLNGKTYQIPNKKNPEIQNYITTTKASFKSASQTSEMDEFFTIQTRANQTLIITSVKGKTKNKKILDLSGNVFIESIPKNSDSITLLKTEQITYNNSNKTILSNTFTELYQPNLLIMGNSFFANLVTSNYEFKGNVKTTFLPYSNSTTN